MKELIEDLKHLRDGFISSLNITYIALEDIWAVQTQISIPDEAKWGWLTFDAKINHALEIGALEAGVSVAVNSVSGLIRIIGTSKCISKFYTYFNDNVKPKVKPKTCPSYAERTLRPSVRSDAPCTKDLMKAANDGYRGGNVENQCPVCTEDLHPNTQIILGNCGHRMHANCLKDLVKNPNSMGLAFFCLSVDPSNKRCNVPMSETDIE